MPKAGGGAPTPVLEQIQLGALALDDQYVYWGGGSGTLQRIAKTGGAVQDVITGEPTAPDLPTPDATDVYFISETSDPLPDHVEKAPKGEGGRITMLATDLDPIKQLALAQDAVYALVDVGPGVSGYIARRGAERPSW